MERYDVTLVSAGTQPRRVARTITEFTALTMREAMEMIDKAPVLILRGAGYATAEEARKNFEWRGATVHVRAYGVDTPAPRRDGIPKRIAPEAVVSFVLMCLATAMTLPALIFILGGGPERLIPCVPAQYQCYVAAETPLPALVMLWLSIPFGSVALMFLILASREIGRSGGELRGEYLVGLGFVMAIAGTLIVAYFALFWLGRAMTESI